MEQKPFEKEELTKAQEDECFDLGQKIEGKNYFKSVRYSRKQGRRKVEKREKSY